MLTLPGQGEDSGYRLVEFRAHLWCYHPMDPTLRSVQGRLPDMTDPGTLGGLLHLVRRVWGNQVKVYQPTNTRFRNSWVVRTEDRMFEGQSEGEALLLALEGAQ